MGKKIRGTGKKGSGKAEVPYQGRVKFWLEYVQKIKYSCVSLLLLSFLCLFD